MKRFLTLCLMVLAALCTLTGCCGEEEADLVFVNACDGAVVAVSGTMRNCPDQHQSRIILRTTHPGMCCQCPPRRAAHGLTPRGLPAPTPATGE